MEEQTLESVINSLGHIYETDFALYPLASTAKCQSWPCLINSSHLLNKCHYGHNLPFLIILLVFSMTLCTSEAACCPHWTTAHTECSKKEDTSLKGRPTLGCKGATHSQKVSRLISKCSSWRWRHTTNLRYRRHRTDCPILVLWEWKQHIKCLLGFQWKLFPMELYWAHRGSICCFQDFLKEKNEASVSDGQCWERVKWGRLLHSRKSAPYWEGSHSHSEPPRRISPKGQLRFLSSCPSCARLRDSGYPWTDPHCWCL